MWNLSSCCTVRGENTAVSCCPQRVHGRCLMSGRSSVNSVFARLSIFVLNQVNILHNVCARDTEKRTKSQKGVDSRVHVFAKETLIWRCCFLPLKCSNQGGFYSLSPVPRVNILRAVWHWLARKKSAENLSVPPRFRRRMCLASLCIIGQELTCSVCLCFFFFNQP